MIRAEIYLDEIQASQLDEIAAMERTNRSTIIRRAIDAFLAKEPQDAAAWRDDWREAVAETAGIAPYLGGGAEHLG